ncbi:MAG: TonB-dependent receptor, partial [Verrucomicrobiota bacterium]
RNRSAPLDYKLADIDPDSDRDDAYNIDLQETVIEGGQTHTYSIAVHADELLGSPDWLPFNVSLYYNESENFQGGAGRNDMFGQPISAPTGNTRDKSILVSTKNGKYSLKVTDYKTSVQDATSAYLQNTWIMGNILALGETWSNVHSYNIAEGETLDGVREDNPTYRQWRFNMKNPDGVFDQAYEDLAVADWRAYRDAVITTFPTFAEAWSLDGLGTEVKRFVQRNPTGLAYTEDATSIGKEFEFTASPNQNLRLTMNASQTEAFRNNVGGRQVIEFVELTDWYFANTEAGNIRLYGGGGANTTAKQWNKFRAKYSLTKLLEGTASPELREWRFNAVGNYRFNEGFLKGFSVGGGFRWADDVVLGYDLTEDENGDPVYDLNSPHIGPTDTKVDLTFSYRKKLENGMNWRVQLNVRDIFAEKELIPISTQPDGSWAAVRIPGSTTWQLTNVFEF